MRLLKDLKDLKMSSNKKLISLYIYKIYIYTLEDIYIYIY